MRYRTLAFALIFPAASACGDGGPVAVDNVTVDLSAEWQAAAPASVGIDGGRMDAAVAHAATLPRLLSLLVVRHGRLVVEEYFNGSHADSLNDVRSVTKSVLSTLTGIAARRGEIDIDESIAGHLTPWAADIDDVERTISVRHLLTMSGGWTWDESTAAGYNDWVLSADPIAYALQRPRAGPPGSSFRYNSAGVHLLGVVLEDAVGRELPAYADEHLFTPLGISRVRWEIFPDGRVNGGAGIDLRARDLAKLGQLWLQNGDAGGNTVVDPDWLERGTTPAYAYWQGSAPLGRQSYGWLWWISDSPGPHAFFAWGHGGQFVWIVPSLDLVVIVTHDWRNAGSLVGQLPVNGLDLIVNRVLRAVQ